MRLPASGTDFLQFRAPISLGAFFVCALACLGGCRERPSEAWPGETVAAESAAFSSSRLAGEDHPDEEIGATHPPGAPTAGRDHLRFVSHNLRNWLTMGIAVGGETSHRLKSEEEKLTTVTVLVRHRPDILGLCEIGDRDDLADLTRRLRAGGLDLPHAHHAGGADPERNLALLSAFPIASSRNHENLTYRLDGRVREMSRGILDVTLDTPLGELRLLGVHLKSKREIPGADQSLIRLAEAHLLRALADRILTAEPDTRLIVYGDLNDTRDSPTLRAIRGPADGPLALRPVGLRDSRNQAWTYHWDHADIYSRIDFVLLNDSVRHLFRWDASYVIDDPEVMRASDHRPLLLSLGIR